MAKNFAAGSFYNNFNPIGVDINQNSVKMSTILIDLTSDDDEPTPKKIILSGTESGSSSAVASFVGIDEDHPRVRKKATNGPSTSSHGINVMAGRLFANGPSTSRATHVTVVEEDQPGPSNGLPAVPRCEICFHESIFYLVGDIELECKHHFCHHCFKDALMKNLAPTLYCAANGCMQEITDEVVKKALHPYDYINFLEHHLNILRDAWRVQALELGMLRMETPNSQDNSEVVVLEDSMSQERRRSELLTLHNLDAMSYVKNSEPFDCPICFIPIGIAEGVILKNCLHTFCRECLEETVKHAEDPVVPCPFNSELGTCEFFIQDREIRALVGHETYERHLSKALQRGESNLENVFHCKSPDCAGFIQYDVGATAFPCQLCEKVNCIKCEAIHEEKTCQQYQDDLKNDVKNVRELQLTEEAVQKMITKGEVSESSSHPSNFR